MIIFTQIILYFLYFANHPAQTNEESVSVFWVTNRSWTLLAIVPSSTVCESMFSICENVPITTHLMVCAVSLLYCPVFPACNSDRSTTAHAKSRSQFCISWFQCGLFQRGCFFTSMVFVCVSFMALRSHQQRRYRLRFLFASVASFIHWWGLTLWSYYDYDGVDSVAKH